MRKLWVSSGPAAPRRCWSIQPARSSILGLMIPDAFVWPGSDGRYKCLTRLVLPGDRGRWWSLSQGWWYPRSGRTAAMCSHDPTILAWSTDQQFHARPFISTVTTFLPHSFCRVQALRYHSLSRLRRRRLFLLILLLPQGRACAPRRRSMAPHWFSARSPQYKPWGSNRESGWLYWGWVLGLRGHTTSKGMSEMMTRYINEGHAYCTQVVLV